MSHPVPGHDYAEQHSEETNKEYGHRSHAHLKKQSPMVHNSPEFKELRKASQGVNATRKGSLAKSMRRHEAKGSALKNAMSKPGVRSLRAHENPRAIYKKQHRVDDTDNLYY